MCFMNRLLSKIFKGTAIILLLSLIVGCGRVQKKEQQEAVTEDNGKVLSVFAIFPTPVEEPWADMVHKGFLKAQEEGLIGYSFEENTGYAHFDSILHASCSKGYDIIAGDAFGSEASVRETAAEFPDIVFFFGSGEVPNGTNLSVFDDLVHEPAYLAGMAAGSVTRNSRIGIVAAMPIPEINRLTNAFITGARDMNPDASFDIAYIDEFYNPQKADSLAEVFIRNGADVIFADRKGAENACVRHHVPVICNMFDQFTGAQDILLTHIIWDMRPAIRHLVSKVSNGTYVSEDYSQWSTLGKGGSRLGEFAGWSQGVTPELIETIVRKKEAIINGDFAVPLIDTPPGP